jgi:hypothetical protein
MAVYVDRRAPVHEHYYHERNSAAGWVVGLIVALLLAWLLFAYGLPAFRSVSSGPNFSIPSKIDVNFNQGGAGAAAPAPGK